MKKSVLHILDKPLETLARETTVMPNRESLKLYREILKFSKNFNWSNEHGQIWKDIINQGARKEFEIAKDEKDPLLIMKMIVTSRESIQNTREKMSQEIVRYQKQIDDSRINQRYDSGHRNSFPSQINKK